LYSNINIKIQACSYNFHTQSDPSMAVHTMACTGNGTTSTTNMHPKYTYQQGLQQGGQKGLQQRRRVQQRHAGGLGRFRHRSPVGRALQGEKTFDAVGGVPDLFPRISKTK
jgi:hypothetical protein